MAVSKKYAGLPDLDAAPEIYETPELTDDASTVQTGTLRTESPTPSEDNPTSDERLDRQRLDRDEARRRFEPAVVDARDVNFSDIVGGSRKSYITKNRRRRRRRRSGGEEYGDLSDDEDENLETRIARLRREAEEVRLELDRREKEPDANEDFEDSVEQQQQHSVAGDIDATGIDELSNVINGLHLRNSATKNGAGRNRTSEASLAKQLANGPAIEITKAEVNGHPRKADSNAAPPANSTISAIGAFADRLTMLETALGISTTDPLEQKTSILSNLNSLSDQITTLSSTLAPSRTSSGGHGGPVIAPTGSSLPNLDIISMRVRTLVSEADRLAESRKAALKSLNDLHEARLRQTSSTPYGRHHNPRSGSSAAVHGAGRDEADALGNADLKLQSQLFLDEQSNKITALYQILPTIQNLEPLLPVVLDRLRALSVVHAGASEAKAGLDDVERKQAETDAEVAKWRDAVEVVERSMKEFGEGVKVNVETVGEMVRGLEMRVEQLQNKR